jgi:coenzyme F420 hydrogenase subunit beta
MKRDRPWEGEYFIARTYEELQQSQGSKYMIIPMNHVLQEIRNLPGKYAYAALPCQVHGYRMLAAEDLELASKIHCVIGLFCGGSLEPYLVPEILRTKGLKPDDIKDFEFRGGDWPGKLRAIKKDGTIRDMHNYFYNDGAYNYLTHLYTPKRCQTCLDGSGQFSDVSVSDAWTRDEDGDYLFEAQSRMLIRTQNGMDVVQRAIDRGSISSEDVSGNPNYKTHAMQTKRKGSGAPIRIERWRAKGIAVPEYDVEFEPFTGRERLNERASAFFLWCGQHTWIRYPLLKFLTSPASIPIIKVRRIIKKRKYAKRKKQAATRKG